MFTTFWCNKPQSFLPLTLNLGCGRRINMRNGNRTERNARSGQHSKQSLEVEISSLLLRKQTEGWSRWITEVRYHRGTRAQARKWKVETVYYRCSGLWYEKKNQQTWWLKSVSPCDACLAHMTLVSWKRFERAYWMMKIRAEHLNIFPVKNEPVANHCARTYHVACRVHNHETVQFSMSTHFPLIDFY